MFAIQQPPAIVQNQEPPRTQQRSSGNNSPNVSTGNNSTVTININSEEASGKRKPSLAISYRVMPFDPPYPPGTVIAGIHFVPRMLDVRLSLSVERADVRNLDLVVFLINTSGQLLSIPALAQLTEFPGITTGPVDYHPNVHLPDSATVIGQNRPSTVPVGATTPMGSLQMSGPTWRIHCDKLLSGYKPEFVFMVTRPYRTKMIEGFVLRGTYEYSKNGRSLKGNIDNITEFDDAGMPRVLSTQELDELRKKYPPRFLPSGAVMEFRIPQPPQ